jgi:hypothetical protein
VTASTTLIPIKSVSCVWSRLPIATVNPPCHYQSTLSARFAAPEGAPKLARNPPFFMGVFHAAPHNAAR